MGIEKILPSTMIGDPYYRGHGRGHGRGRGRGRGWLNEDVSGRDLDGGRGRFYFRGNGRDQNGQYRSGCCIKS